MAANPKAILRSLVVPSYQWRDENIPTKKIAQISHLTAVSIYRSGSAAFGVLMHNRSGGDPTSHM